jgi:hypothetical protein
MDEDEIRSRLLALRHALAELIAAADALPLLERLMQHADLIEAEAEGNEAALTRAGLYRAELIALARVAHNAPAPSGPKAGPEGRPKADR